MSELSPEFPDLATDAAARASSAEDSDWLMHARIFDPGALAKGKVGGLCLEAAVNGDFDIEITAEGLLMYSARLGHIAKEAELDYTRTGKLNKVYSAQGLSRIEIDVQPFGMPRFTFFRDGSISRTKDDGLEKPLGFWASRLLHRQLTPLYVVPQYT